MELQIKLILAERHAVVRQALRLLLEREDDMQVLAEASDGETLLRLVQSLTPNLVLMDISIPGPSGVELTRRLLAEHPQLQVLALSSHTDRQILQQMLAAGARGYMFKSSPSDALLYGIRTVAAGKRYLCPDATALIIDAPTPPPDNAVGEVLTQRERQILVLLAEGLPRSKRIDAVAAMTTATAGFERFPILSGIDTRAGLALLAGDRARYRHWLNDFVRHAPSFAAQIRAALAAGHTEHASRCAHTFKGRTGLLGMHALHALATKRRCAPPPRRAKIPDWNIRYRDRSPISSRC